MTDRDDSGSLLGQTLGKKYLVRRVIGAGGMGAVYEAEHLVTKRIGALKLLHQSAFAAERAAERFLREASAAGHIGNPHIVETFDAGELPDGRPYIFMELLNGRPLRDLMRERGRLPFEQARQIALQAAEGLGAAHAAGIVHRDVKPDNLFICDGDTPFLKILDFGISKFAEQHGLERLTEQGTAVGTPHYMSPEQVVSKREIDARVDVYALGVVFYECVTGKVPFDAATLPALSIKIFEGAYTPASELVADAPPELDAILGRAMARDPGQRFASMQELGEALKSATGMPPQAGATLASVQANQDQPALPQATALLEVTPPIASTFVLPASHSAGPKASTIPRWTVLFVLFALVLAIGVLALRSQGGESVLSESASASLPSAAPAMATPSLAPVPPISAPAVSASVTAQLPLPPRPKAVMPSASAASSPAARDGLVEKNPFAD